MLNRLLSWTCKNCDHGWGGKHEGQLTHRQQEDNWNLGNVFVSYLFSTELVFDKYPVWRRGGNLKLELTEQRQVPPKWLESYVIGHELCLHPCLRELCAFTRKGQIFRIDSGRKVSWQNKLFTKTCHLELIAPADKTTSFLMSCWLNWHIGPGHIIWIQQYVGKKKCVTNYENTLAKEGGSDMYSTLW